jgi:hypothetical protein
MVVHDEQAYGNGPLRCKPSATIFYPLKQSKGIRHIP